MDCHTDMKDALRQTGRSTKQMLHAPPGSVYVWPCDNSIDYAKALAEYLGRSDLEIIAVYRLRPDKIRGRRLTGVMVDHAVRLTTPNFLAISNARESVVPS